MISRHIISFHLEGPFLSRSTIIGGFGIDAVAARLPDKDGTLYLPGSLLIGRIRDALRALGRVDSDYDSAVARWFGDRDDEVTGIPQRRQVFISDLRFVTKHTDATRTRIAVDPISDSVLDGALQVLEAPFAIGENITCSGELRLLGRADEIEAFLPRLRKALGWLTQVGGLRTVGFGVIRGFDLEEKSRQAVRTSTAVSGRLCIVLDIHDSLCVGETRNDPNGYVSSDVIPGGTLKGTLAELILAELRTCPGQTVTTVDTSPLGRNFTALRFTHAFPVSRPAAHAALPDRPSRIPLSWCEAPESVGNDAGLPKLIRKKAFYDAAYADNPAAAYIVDGEAPAFIANWKKPARKRAMGMVGWSTPPTDLRIRSAIDANFRSAKANQLFSIEYQDTTDHLWVGEIDLSDVPKCDRKEVIAALDQRFSEGLVGLGRGGSSAAVRLERAPEQPTLPIVDRNGRIVLILQSAALLREPWESGDVTNAYRQAFDDLAPNAGLTLAAIFVRERLSGGDFLAKRRSMAGGYRPYLLTQPGSTFVFDIDPRSRVTAMQFVADWLRRGLDVPGIVCAAYGLEGDTSALWKHCPFVRENGYGEVSSTTRIVAGSVAPPPLNGPGIVALPSYEANGGDT